MRDNLLKNNGTMEYPFNSGWGKEGDIAPAGDIPIISNNYSTSITKKGIPNQQDSGFGSGFPLSTEGVAEKFEDRLDNMVRGQRIADFLASVLHRTMIPATVEIADRLHGGVGVFMGKIHGNLTGKCNIS